MVRTAFRAVRELVKQMQKRDRFAVLKLVGILASVYAIGCLDYFYWEFYLRSHRGYWTPILVWLFIPMCVVAFAIGAVINEKSNNQNDDDE